MPKRVRAAIEDTDNNLYLSAASLWETAIKIRTGKLHVPDGSIDFLLTTANGAGVRLPAIDTAHLRQTQSLPMFHRDPFDRMLVAQAIIEKLTLVTADATLRQYSVMTLW